MSKYNNNDAKEAVEWSASKAKMQSMEKIAKAKKKKAGRPTKQKKAIANYGSNENRRECHKCKSTASRVNSCRHVGRLTFRYRKCCDCGTLRVTREEIITTV
jgi:ferredoxin-like protein FixX